MTSHDPLYRAAEAETERRAEIKWSLLEDLFCITLTTIDGAAAFADYCQELRDLCENELEEGHLFDALEKISQLLKIIAAQMSRGAGTKRVRGRSRKNPTKNEMSLSFLECYAGRP
jgi:hypothetical protein